MDTRRYKRVYSEEKITEVKIELCRAIRRVAMREGWSQKDMARYLSASESRVGHAVRFQVDKLTLNQLFLYLTVLYPQFRVMVSL
jgi:predicted XRE-type DNA-binding protein